MTDYCDMAKVGGLNLNNVVCSPYSLQTGSFARELGKKEKRERGGGGGGDDSNRYMMARSPFFQFALVY